MGGPVVVGALELQHDIAGTIDCQSFVGNGGAGDVAAQVFQLFALMGGAAHLGMEAEALRVDAAHGRQWRLLTDYCPRLSIVLVTDMVCWHYVARGFPAPSEEPR